VSLIGRSHHFDSQRGLLVRSRDAGLRNSISPLVDGRLTAILLRFTMPGKSDMSLSPSAGEILIADRKFVRHGGSAEEDSKNTVKTLTRPRPARRRRR
jgi:hypothetical protein